MPDDYWLNFWPAWERMRWRSRDRLAALLEGRVLPAEDSAWIEDAEIIRAHYKAHPRSWPRETWRGCHRCHTCFGKLQERLSEEGQAEHEYCRRCKAARRYWSHDFETPDVKGIGISCDEVAVLHWHRSSGARGPIMTTHLPAMLERPPDAMVRRRQQRVPFPVKKKKKRS